jgi:hypothetical protein
MELTSTLAASLERGKPTSIINEHLAPPPKSFAHRFCTYLVLFSFFLQTTVPVLAMDAGAKDPQELRREFGRRFRGGAEMVQNPSKGEKAVTVIAFLKSGDRNQSESFDGILTEQDPTSAKSNVQPKESAKKDKKPTLTGTNYARWVSDMLLWVRKHQKRLAFPVNITYEGQEILVPDVPYRGDPFSDLMAEVCFKDVPTHEKTILLVSGLLKVGGIASLEERCVVEHIKHRQPSPDSSPCDILICNEDLFVPRISSTVYERPAVSGVPGLDRPHRFPPAREIIREGEKNLQAKSYKLRAQHPHKEASLLVNGVFTFASQEYQSSPYLYKDEDTFHLTRTVKSIQEKGSLEYTAPTPIQIEATLTGFFDDKRPPRNGLFDLDLGWWMGLDRFYQEEDSSGRYQWDF